MAITGVSNLAELISNQSLGQGQEAPAAPQPAQTQEVAAPGPAQDSFIPSSQNISAQVTAQEAGLFQVSPFALGVATSEILTAQTAALSTPQDAVPAQAAQISTADIPNAQAAPAITQNIQIPAAPPPATAAAATPVATSPSTAGVADSAIASGELQSMNAELLGLGLNINSVQIIDRIATLANNYNPLVYGDLIQQFEAQAAQQAASAHSANQSAAPTKGAGS